MWMFAWFGLDGKNHNGNDASPWKEWEVEPPTVRYVDWQSVGCFLAGAGVVAGLWCFHTIWNLLPDEITAEDSSWVDPWNTLRENTWKVIVENSEFYYYNHIGELPVTPKPRRTHWPWETIGRRVFSKESTRNNVIDKNDDSRNGNPKNLSSSASHQSSFVTADEMDCDVDESNQNKGDAITNSSSNEDNDDKNSSVGNSNKDRNSKTPIHLKKEFCIGSIFGMDVGGTLAKLVYFEQKTDDFDPMHMNHLHHHHYASRERHYAMAASAQAVLKARNSMTMTNSSTYRLTGETKSGAATPRRRSLSLGCMGRFKELQKQMYQTESGSTNVFADENDLTTPSSNTTPAEQQPLPRRKGNSHRPMHSVASQLDLDYLKHLRQESVPDDLAHFRASVHFQPTEKELARHFVEGNYNDKEQDYDPAAHPIPASSSIKKSRSMFDLSQSQQKAVALDRFYSFARRLDSYENSVRDHQLSFYSRELGGEFHFLHFESRWMHHAMDLIRYHNLHLNIAKMGATGGGAHKYAKEWEDMLGIQMDKQEELDSLVAGMQFVLSTVVGECYTFRPQDCPPSSMPAARATSSLSCSSSSTSKPENGGTDNHANFQDDHPIGAPLTDDEDEPHPSNESSRRYIETVGPIGTPLRSMRSKSKLSVETGTDSQDAKTKGESTANAPPARATAKSKVDEWWWSRKVQRDAISYSTTYPYLLVTIGTGVSILRVDGPRKHERISGSTIGGGTYWGLIRLLTDVEDFEDVMRLAEKGDPAKVDMMVGDIYGDNSDALEKLGLPTNVVASSFGKLVSKEDPAEGLEQEDLARALLLMITNNIGQVSYLNAKLHNTRRIYFVGNFLRGNTLSQRRLSYAIDYWSKGEMEALFLEHEGYFGALGAFLMSQKISQDDGGSFQWGGSTPTSKESQRKSRDRSSLNMQRRLNTFGA